MPLVSYSFVNKNSWTSWEKIFRSKTGKKKSNKKGKKVKKKGKIVKQVISNKTLNFFSHFRKLGLAEAELSDKTGNMFSFYLNFIRIAQSKSKVEGKKHGVKISNSVNISASN